MTEDERSKLAASGSYIAQADRGATAIVTVYQTAAPAPVDADRLAAAEARLAAEPDSLRARGGLGLALAGAGDYVRARPILEDIWQKNGGRVAPFFGLFGDDSAAALIAIRRADSKGAYDAGNIDELLAAFNDDVRRKRQAGANFSGWFGSADYEEGIAAFWAGERGKGLALIAKAAEGGFFIWPNEAYLQELYDDPGFAPIRAAQEARQARERGKVLAIVCTDNPYAAVWQPAEGTCETFAASNSE